MVKIMHNQKINKDVGVFFKADVYFITEGFVDDEYRMEGEAREGRNFYKVYKSYTKEYWNIKQQLTNGE
jgi:hypothetical protein